MNNRELWQRLLLTLPDSRFFDILRNYLGKIKTPFHKPDLISQLTAFFLKEETQRRIVASLTEEDIRVLTAFDFLGTPEPRQLFTLLAETEDTFSLHHHLMNLEYRLLLLTDTSGPAPVIRCNPLLAELIRREVVNPAVLFSSVPVDVPVNGENTVKNSSPSALPWLQETLITAFLSYIDKNRGCLRNDGSFKKRQDRDLRALFPFLFQKHRFGKRLNLL